MALDALVETVRWFLFFLVLERAGAEMLARATIVYGCYIILLIPIHGYSETACSMTSNLIGQEEPGLVGALLRRTISLGFLTLVPVLLFVILFPGVVLSIFTSEPGTIAGCADALRVVAVAMAVVLPADALYSAIAGSGATRVVLLIEIAMTVIILAYVAITALGLGLALEWVWVAEILGWTVCLVLSFGWLRSGRWRQQEL